MKSGKKYASKIMLVGEYGVILGGEALTIPFPRYHGVIRGCNDFPQDGLQQRERSVRYLKALYEYLSGIEPAAFHARPDLQLFLKNLDSFWIEMNIPVSYGLGSSAVVSAAIYEHFFSGAARLGLNRQKNDLARIESFFHGKSSGVDALSCYVGRPLHFRGKDSIRVIDFEAGSLPGQHALFLLDSGAGSDTGSLVSQFLRSMEEGAIEKTMRKEYLPLNRKLIASLRGQHQADPALLFGLLSEFQLRHFRKMIPDKFLDVWVHGLHSKEYYLKLNGSGGGYLLGIAPGAKRKVLDRRWGDGLVWIA